MSTHEVILKKLTHRPLTSRSPNSGSARTNPTPALTHRTVPNTPTTNTTSQPATPQNAAVPVVTPEAPRRQPAREADPAPGAQNPIQLSDLQNFLQRIGPDPEEGGQQQSGELNERRTFPPDNNIFI